MTDEFPQIGDYALIGDCFASALVSREGSIDWCCMPRLDSPSVFGRLLDRDAGYCAITPRGRDFEASRRYLDRTLVLETTFRSSDGDARVFDLFTLRSDAVEPDLRVLRIVEGIRGHVTLGFRAAPRFDYGEVRPWLHRRAPNVYTAIGGNQGLELWSDFPVEVVDRHDLEGNIVVRPGERAHFSMTFAPPDAIEDEGRPVPRAGELDERLDQTVQWWRRWAERIRLEGPNADAVVRSAIVLKALSNPRTGAIAAAPTTSLPALIPGPRNWDYRYSWVRDSVFTVRALFGLGCEEEPEHFRRFVERSSAGTGTEVQVMFGLAGERRLTEIELGHLSGYRDCAPVRIGNDAWRQTQLDVYGQILDLAWHWYVRGHSPDDDYWEFIVELVNTACERWQEPDSGMWEVRSAPEHFVHSKVMCWAALDRGVRLAEACSRSAPVDRWQATAKEIKDAVESDGFDAKRNVFRRSFGSPAVDASLLLIPTTEFCAYDDERMIDTTDAIADELGSRGLLQRYKEEDGLLFNDNPFLPCSFWLAECYARQGRQNEARAWFDRAAATANDVGLFSEQFDLDTGELRGNFPQGLTHLSHVAAAAALFDGGDHERR